MKIKLYKQNKGFTAITLLVFTATAIIITSAAIVAAITSSQSIGSLQSGENTLSQAESGMEKALLALLRDPNYSGESFTTGNGTVTINITQGNPVTIVSKSVNGSFVRIVQVQAGWNNNQLTIQSWKEVY